MAAQNVNIGGFNFMRKSKIVFGSAAVGLALLGSFAAQARSRLDATAIDQLRDLRKAYASIDNVYMDASVTMWVRGRDDVGTPGAEGEGRYEYWAAGDQYRHRTAFDAALGLSGNMDIAFDGLRFQLYDEAMDTLAVQRIRPDALPVQMPNPLFLAVDFLSRDDDRCPACPLRLGSVGERARWDDRLDQATLGRRVGQPIIRIPGGVLAGATFHYEVTMNGGLPSQIDRYTADGRIMTRVVLRDYREVALGGGTTIPIPHTMVLAAADFQGDGGQFMYADIVVDALRVNQRMSANAFALDFGTAGNVWDGDERRFLKHATKRPEDAPKVHSERVQ